MNYCIINSDNIIENIIVASPDFAKENNLPPSYPSASIGQPYNPPAPTYESYIGTGLSTFTIPYLYKPQSIILSTNDETVLLPFGMTNYNGIVLSWGESQVTIESIKWNQTNVLYYVTFIA